MTILLQASELSGDLIEFFVFFAFVALAALGISMLLNRE